MNETKETGAMTLGEGCLRIFAVAAIGIVGLFILAAIFASHDATPVTPAEHRSIQELKDNCLRLAATPTSLYTPFDKDDWDFCKEIIVRHR